MTFPYNRSKNSSGFTLIELLVVLSLISIIVSFVAPYSIKAIESTEKRSELINLEKYVKKWHVDGFYHGGNISMLFEDGAVSVYAGSILIDNVSFTYLTFPRQQIWLPSSTKIQIVTLELIRNGNLESINFALG